MENTKAKSILEEEIKQAIEQVSVEETRVAYVLSQLHLEPIEKKLFNRYKTWVGDGRLRFHPMAVIKAMLMKDLKSISSFQLLISYLCSNPEEGKLLGFDMFLPSNQTLSIIKNERVDDEIQQLMDFVVEKVRQYAKENGRHMDIDFLPVSKQEREIAAYNSTSC